MSGRTAAVAWSVAVVVVLAAGTAGALSGDGRRDVALTTPAASPSVSASPLTASPSAPDLSPTERAELAAVKLSLPCETDDGVCGYGSGSVVDSTGLILTNAHVVAPSAPGLAEQYDDLAETVEDPEYVVVSVVPAPEAEAVPRYRAEVVAVDGYADLAVVRVVAAVDGGPLTEPVQLDNVPLGALAEARKDDAIRVVGFPESGSSESPTVERGTISSRPIDPQGRVDGAWELNTSAPIHSGNSGGLVVDESGRLLAIPTYSQGVFEQTYRARAVELALPLLAAVRAGRPYVSKALVAATGEERLAEALWSGDRPGGACVEFGEVVVAGEADVLAVQARLTGMAVGEHYRLVVSGPDGQQFASLQGAWDDPGCLQLEADEFPKPGNYLLRAFVGPTPELAGTSTVVVVG